MSDISVIEELLPSTPPHISKKSENAVQNILQNNWNAGRFRELTKELKYYCKLCPNKNFTRIKHAASHIRFKHKHIKKQHLLEVKYGTEVIPNPTVLEDFLINCDKMDFYRNNSNIYIENTKEKIDIDNASVEESDLAELLEEIKQIINNCDTDSQEIHSNVDRDMISKTPSIEDALEEEETNKLLEEINQILNAGFNKRSSQKSLYVENDLLEKETIEDSEVDVDSESTNSNQVLDLTIDETSSEKSLELEIIEKNNIHDLLEEVDMDLESENSNEVVDLTIEDKFLEKDTHRQEERILQNQVFQKDSKSIYEVDKGRLEFLNCPENMYTTRINEDVSSCHFENVTSNLDDEKLTTCKSNSDESNNFTYQDKFLNVSSEEKDLWDLLEEIKVQEEQELNKLVKSDFKNHQKIYDDTYQQPKGFSSKIVDLSINETFCLEGKGNVTESSIPSFNLDSKIQISSVQMLDAINVDNDPSSNQIKISEKLTTESLRTNCQETVLNKSDIIELSSSIKESVDLTNEEESKDTHNIIQENFRSNENSLDSNTNEIVLNKNDDSLEEMQNRTQENETIKEAQVKQNNNLVVKATPSDDIDKTNLAVEILNKKLFDGKGNVTESSIPSFNLDSKIQISSVQMLDAINVDSDPSSKKNQITISEKRTTESLRTNCQENVLNKSDIIELSSSIKESVDLTNEEESKDTQNIIQENFRSNENSLDSNTNEIVLIKSIDKSRPKLFLSKNVYINLTDDLTDEDSFEEMHNRTQENETIKEAQVKQNNNLGVKAIPSDDIDKTNLAVEILNKKLFDSIRNLENTSDLTLICNDNQPYNKTNSSDTFANKNPEDNRCDINEKNYVTGNVVSDTQISNLKSIPTLNIDSDVLKDNYSENISNNDGSLQNEKQLRNLENTSVLTLICNDNQPYNKTNSSDYTFANKNPEDNCEIKEKNYVTGNVVSDTQISNLKSIPTLNIDSDILKDNYLENISNNNGSLQNEKQLIEKNTEAVKKCEIDITNFEMFNECFQIIDEIETINLEIEENLSQSTNIGENGTNTSIKDADNKNTSEPKNKCNLKLNDNKISTPETNKENLIGKVKEYKKSNPTTKKIAKKVLDKPFKCRSCPKRSFKERPDAIAHIVSKHGRAAAKILLYKMGDIVTNNLKSNQNMKRNKSLIHKNDTITNQKETATKNLKSTSPVQLKGSKRKCEHDPTELGEVAKRPCLDRESSRKIETISSGTSCNITPTLTPDLNLNSGRPSSAKSSSELDSPNAATLSTDKNSGPNSVLNIKNQNNSSKSYKYTPPILIGTWGKNQSFRFPKISPYFWPFGKKT